MSEIVIIANPSSAGGKTGMRLPAIARELAGLLAGRYRLALTARPGHAEALARGAILSGVKLVVALGGDGTIQEVVNGLLSGGRLMNPDCELGIISSGTGHGFAQSLGLPAGLRAQCELLDAGGSRQVDVGLLRYRDRNGATIERYFVNECQLGIGAEVVQGVRENHKRLGGRIGFGVGAFQKAFVLRNEPYDVALDARLHLSDAFTGIVIANGAFTGGGMNLVPTARVDDGVLSVLLMHHLSLPQRIWNLPRVYSGSHLRSSCFSVHEASRVEIRSSTPAAVEADGELLGNTPCSVELLRSVLRVRSLPQPR